MMQSNSKKQSRRMAYGVIAAALIVGVAVVGVRRSRVAQPDGGDAVTQTSEDGRTRSASLFASGGGRAPEPAATTYPEGEDVPDDVPPPGTENLIYIPSLEKRVGARRPQLIEHRHLADKAIRTEQENARMKALMADPKMIATVAEDLRGARERSLDQTRQLQRTYEVDFLAQGMSWKENPAWEQVKAAVRDSIAFDNLGDDRPADLRKSFLGDKMELLAVLRVHDPNGADALLAELEHTPMKKAMTYADYMARYLQESATEGALGRKGGAGAPAPAKP